MTQSLNTSHSTEFMEIMAGFDYKEVEPSVGGFLRGQAQRIRSSLAKSILHIGKDLIEAKRHLSHGQFVRWVECEVGIPARTAQGYMRIAKWAGDKSAKFAQLPPSILYLLSARTTPQSVVEQAFRRLDEGDTLSIRCVRELLKSTKSRTESNEESGLQNARRSRNDTSATPRMRALSQESGILHELQSPSDDVIRELISILARSLSQSDLIRVREIVVGIYCSKNIDVSSTLYRAFDKVVSAE